MSALKFAPGLERVSRGVATVLVCGAATLGCPDPEGLFDEFSEQLEAKPTAPTGDCGETVQEVHGSFFLALATQLSRKEPIVLLADVRTDADGMAMTLQPLRYDDRVTPVGDPIEVPPTPIADDGTFSALIVDILIPAEAMLIADGDIEATSLTLSGSACEDLICGGVDAQITKPLVITLTADKSRFAMQRIDGPPYPEPPTLDCAGGLANPL